MHFSKTSCHIIGFETQLSLISIQADSSQTNA